MKKIQFIAITMAATALFASSCGEDEELNGVKPEAPTEGVTALNEKFDGTSLGAKVASISGWQELQAKGIISWTVAGTANEKYAEVNAERAQDGTSIDVWLLTPALDLGSTEIKTLSFRSAFAFPRDGSSLRLYVMTKNSTADADVTEIAAPKVHLAGAVESDKAGEWMASGDVDLSGFAGIVYVGFRYTAVGGNDRSSTYRIDDVKFGYAGGVVPGESVVLLAETFGNAATASPWPSIAEYAGFTKTGVSAANASYTSEGGTVSVRGNSSSSYDGASGSCNAMMAAAGASFIIKNIASCGARNISLSFGSNHINDSLLVSFSVNNGTSYTPIDYTKTTSSWGLVETSFQLPEGTACFALKFAGGKTQYGVRIDDLNISTTEVSGDPDPCNGTTPDPDPEPVDAVFSETFGTTASGNPSVTAYDGYSKQGKGAANIAWEAEGGAVSVRTTSPSSGYDGASGVCNAMMAAAGASLVVKNIASCGAQNMKLTFGSNQTNDTITFAYSADNGTTWIPVTYTKAETVWGKVDLTFQLPAGTTCFALKFTATKTQYGARVDDILITTNDATGAAANCGGSSTPDPGIDPDPVASLSEDFETFTSGAGTAYMSTQSDSKGWKGVSVQGTLEADVRLNSNNNYVQLSAHRNSITTATEQEFWLISPRLDLDAASAKQLVFETSGGYFNASTVFEVYVLDSDNPATASKTKLTPRIAQESDMVSGSYTPYISSGSIDLSAHSGVRRIGFYYKGTSGSGNSTTYMLDNFAFGAVTTVPTLAITSPSAVSANVSATFTHTFATHEANLTGTTVISCDNLPAWLTLSGATLSGTAPAEVGTFALNIVATNDTIVATQTLTVTVDNPGATLAKWSFSSEADISADEGSGTLSKTATGNITYTASSKTIYCNGWDATVGKHWLLTISPARVVTGVVTVTLQAYGTNTAPQHWKLQGSNNNTTWVDGTAIAHTATIAEYVLTVDVTSTPVAASGTLYLRLVTTDLVSINGSTVQAGGNSRLAEITVSQ